MIIACHQVPADKFAIAFIRVAGCGQFDRGVLGKASRVGIPGRARYFYWVARTISQARCTLAVLLNAQGLVGHRLRRELCQDIHILPYIAEGVLFILGDKFLALAFDKVPTFKYSAVFRHCLECYATAFGNCT